jgi:hypothetical protein
VLTGQSNSLGTTDDQRDAANMEPPPVPTAPAVQFFWSNLQDVDAPYGDSGGEITELQVQQGDSNNKCFWGPEFGFALRLRQLQPAARRILIVKASRGGGGSGHWCADGHMRSHIISTVSAALAALGRAPGDNEVRSSEQNPTQICWAMGVLRI